MSMTKKSDTPVFEGMDNAAPATSVTGAVAVADSKASALTTQVSREDMHVVAGTRNAMELEYDTFKGIVIEKGFFTEKGSTDSIGNELVISLMSWQELYVCTPKDNNAPAELVRYSADGVTASDGTNMAEHLNSLKEGGYPNAKIEQRIMIAGGLEKSEKPTSLLDKPILINLSPSNRKQFIQYQGESAYAISKGRKTKEQALLIKLTCTVAKYDKNTYGLCNFNFAD